MIPKSLIIFAGVLALSQPCWAADSALLCDRFIFEGSHQPSFNDIERQFLCGSPDNAAWKNVPLNQAQFHLKTMLQNRGYFFPQIEVKGERLQVNVGDPTRVLVFRIEGNAPSTLSRRLRKIEGEILTPDLLNDVEKRVRQQLEVGGYACPEIAIKSDPTKAEIVAHVSTGPLFPIVSIEREKIDGVNVDNLERYQAFHIGDPYDKINLMVTSGRILESNIVQGAFFAVRCQDEGVHLKQTLLAGAPRVFTVGFGVDTERWLFLRTRWQHSRLGENASQLTLGTLVSFSEQSADADMKWFPFSGGSRAFLRSNFKVKRENIEAYDRIFSRVSVGPGASWDNTLVGVEGSAGPAGNLTHTFRGQGQTTAEFFSLYSELTLRSHKYEFYRNSPTEGFEIAYDMDLVQEGVLAPLSGHRLHLGFENHWNLLDLDPPFLVVSLRSGFNSTITPLGLAERGLPSDFRHYLGGSTTVRGFSLREIPGPEGALTTLFAGLETRFPDLLAFNLQPYAFLDFGMTGTKNIHLDSPAFWSPGVGLRWQPAFGVFRVNLGKGFITNAPATGIRSHWQFYFSFGEEF